MRAPRSRKPARPVAWTKPVHAVLALGMILAGCAPRPESPIIPPAATEKCTGIQGYAESFAGRRTFTWRPAWLNLIKTAEAAAPLRARIVARAEQALAGAAPSVVAKTEVPPSGDKHDFLSWPVYWWRTGPNQAEVRDGQHNPESLTSRYDVTALGEMQSRVVYLSLGAFLTDDRRYARKAAELLAVWFVDPATAMNPNMEFAQSIPGKKPGTAIQAIQLVPVVEAIGLLEASPDLAPETRRGLKRWFSRYVDWLQGPRAPVDRWAENNIALGYDLQVIEFALFAGRLDVARTVAQALPAARLSKQIAPDGRLPHETVRTRGLSYSLFSLGLMFQLASLGDCLGLDLWSYQVKGKGGGIRAVLDYLLPYLGREAQWPYRQIDRGDEIQRIRERFQQLLPMAAWIYREPKYLEAATAFRAGHPEADRVWWPGPMALPEATPDDKAGE